MPQNRHTVKSTVVIKPDVAQQFRSGESGNLKVLLYCGLSHSMNAYSQVDVAFPNQRQISLPCLIGTSICVMPRNLGFPMLKRFVPGTVKAGTPGTASDEVIAR